eukprot:scaffold3421_cov181-Amphora_coffeaeformis.AAC.8
MPVGTRRVVYNPKHHPRRSSCFRNPCVVFLCCFLVLASLRFRVRPKRAAQWIQKHSRPLRSRTEPKQSSAVIVKHKKNSMEFQLQEEGKLPTGASFQRYQAIFETGDKKKPVSVQQWTRDMIDIDSSSFQSFLSVLRQNPYQAFFFETRPVTAAKLATTTFEFVLVDAPALHDFAVARPDPQAFAEYFNSCTNACVFTSLHKDATLVAPKPPPDAAENNNNNLATYSHLADFCRKANSELVAATWKLAIQTYVQQVERQATLPLWFSTSGMGIAWLHFRIDQRPKYYTYAKFREEK